jgi:hypothetical protein
MRTLLNAVLNVSRGFGFSGFRVFRLVGLYLIEWQLMSTFVGVCSVLQQDSDEVASESHVLIHTTSWSTSNFNNAKCWCPLMTPTKTYHTWNQLREQHLRALYCALCTPHDVDGTLVYACCAVWSCFSSVLFAWLPAWSMSFTPRGLT